MSVPQAETAGENTSAAGRSNEFQRDSRLLNAAQFAYVFKQNYRTSDKYWTLLYRLNSHGTPRLGMAVAKKKIKKAVDRNRVKRIVRESFRTNQIPSVDIVVLPGAVCQLADRKDLLESLGKHWERIAIKCSAS